jgi:restriction system protein
MRLIAEKSLFAVLLRSPWWMSLGVGILVVLAARAFLPDRYWPFGASGAAPFVVIAVIAFAKQWRRPSAARTQALVERVRAMSWAQFAQALQAAYERDGAQVQRIEGGAADFALARGGRTTLVAARRWKAARHGQEALAALHAQMRSRDASDCSYIALGELSDNAEAFAKSHGVHVLQDAGLAQLLREVR